MDEKQYVAGSASVNEPKVETKSEAPSPADEPTADNASNYEDLREQERRAAMVEHQQIMAREMRELHLTNPLRAFRYILFKRKVHRQKLQNLWEGHLDKKYFEQKMGDQLKYDDTIDRKDLAAESRKPIAEQDVEKIDAIEYRISHSKAIKAAYRKTLSFIDEIESYLSMFGG